MGKGRKENLGDFRDLTAEEQRAIASKGGKASVEARRAKKNLKELVEIMGEKNVTLTINDVLIALSIYAGKDENARRALEQLSNLKGCEVHLSIIPNSVNEATYRRLGVNLTCEPRYETSCMYHRN